MIYLSLNDSSEIKIDSNDYDILRKIRDHFTHYEKDYYWTKSYQSGIWDGKSSLFSSARRTVPFGLFFDLYKFLKYEGYSDLKVEDDIKEIFTQENEVNMNYDLKFYPYDYQKACIEDAIKKSRGIYRVGTGGGKSLIISYIIKNLFDNGLTKKHLIIVPTLGLITQFKDDLIDYGIDKKLIGVANKDHKEFDKTIVVSTWQTLKSNKSKLKNFDLAICDETHQSKAKEINKIMQHCSMNMKFVFGVTGTMPDHPLEKGRVISYIGPVWKEYGTKWLADNGYLSQCNIKHIKVRYKNSFKGDYREIKDEVFRYEYRLQILKAIVENTRSVLILVEKVEDEGEFIKEYLSKELKDRTVVFLSGKDKDTVREKWRKKMEKDDSIVMIATYGIFSMGVNIKSLKNAIILSSSKSKIRILQSIGRSLRNHASKEKTGAFIWDIHDQVKNLQRHGNSRERFYAREEFNIETIEMNEKNDKNLKKLFVPASNKLL